MKKLLAISALALTFASASAYAETLTGMVSDAMCASKGKTNSAECAAKCIKGGSAPVLVVGDKVSNPDKLIPHAGHNVTVEGTVKGDTVTVDTVKM